MFSLIINFLDGKSLTFDKMNLEEVIYILVGYKDELKDSKIEKAENYEKTNNV